MTLHAGRRPPILRKPADRVCCDGGCNEHQGRGLCPRFASPIREQRAIGNAPFVWTLVCIVAAGSAGWIFLGLRALFA